MYEDDKSKVYIKVDEKHNIIAIDGGYTEHNIKDKENWILIDEGYGNRYNLCQNNYLDKPVMNLEYGLYQYAYMNGRIIEKNLFAEIEALKEKEKVDIIRSMREQECFSVINRGSLWYAMLTDSQLDELDKWYHAWLDAPQTLVVPTKPTWL